MAMLAAFPSAEGGPPLLWRRPKSASVMVDGKAANIAIQVIPDESHRQGGIFFSRFILSCHINEKSYEIVSLVEDRPPITPGLLIEAFDTLLCIRISSRQAPTKGAKIQIEVDISEQILTQKL